MEKGYKLHPKILTKYLQLILTTMAAVHIGKGMEWIN
jgi:hypothetical protein